MHTCVLWWRLSLPPESSHPVERTSIFPRYTVSSQAIYGLREVKGAATVTQPGHPGAVLPGRPTFPSGTLLYPLKCKGPGAVGLESTGRWWSGQVVRQGGRQLQQDKRI